MTSGLIRSVIGVRILFCAPAKVLSSQRLTTSGALPRLMAATRSCSSVPCLSSHLTLISGLAFSKSVITLLMYPSKLGDRKKVQNSISVLPCAATSAVAPMPSPSSPAIRERLFIQRLLAKRAMPDVALDLCCVSSLPGCWFACNRLSVTRNLVRCANQFACIGPNVVLVTKGYARAA